MRMRETPSVFTPMAKRMDLSLESRFSENHSKEWGGYNQLSVLDKPTPGCIRKNTDHVCLWLKLIVEAC